MSDEEEFFAWLDGELDDGAAARVAARVAASPDLQVRAEQHRRLGADLRAAFDPVLAEPVSPPAFQAEVIDFGARAVERERRRGWLGVPQWASMAATLALGLFAGTMIGGRSESPVEGQGGQLVAAASLEHSLDTALASAPAEAGPRIGLTFRTAEGAICRSFQDGPASGLACRSGEQWRIEGLFQGAEGQTSDYRMAAGQDPRLSALIGERMAGSPFDAAQEKAARDKGWR